MNQKELIIFKPAPANVSEFVDFWDQQYSADDEDFYGKNIDQELTDERIRLWFKWKNGTPLSPLKLRSIERYSSKGERISADVTDAELRKFLNRDGGAIWRIFWLHIQHPSRFPIYDQHVHRAMAALMRWENCEIPTQNPKKVEMYLEHYRPFLKQFDPIPSRKIDRALWAFGEFLSSPQRANMVNCK